MAAIHSASVAEHHDDPRLKVFCDLQRKDVFHGICQQEQVWQEDLYDVLAIHQDARDTFDRLLLRAAGASRDKVGQMLLLRGIAGSGKTHLMRVFRNDVHRNRHGYCAYLQLTTKTSNYGRFILSNLIDSLDRPYYASEGDRSGLVRLSTDVVEKGGDAVSASLRTLREADGLSHDALARLTNDMADAIVSRDRFQGLDHDLIRALCYLQRDDARVRSRVLKYLRCEELNRFDREYLPEMVSRLHDGHPLEMIQHLGRLIWAASQEALVLLVDQLEGLANFDLDDQRTANQFLMATQTLCDVCNQVPSSLVVIACLDDFYGRLRDAITASIRDRLEQHPGPIQLTANRTADEIRQLIEFRLDELYGQTKREEPLFPFSLEFIERLTGATARDVLRECQKFRAGFQPQGPGSFPPPPPPPLDISRLEQAWSDCRTRSVDVPEAEEELAELLRWAIEACPVELPDVLRFQGEREGRYLRVHQDHGSPGTARLLIALCNRPAQGGGLARQVAELGEKCDGHTPVIVRGTEFPKGVKAKISVQIGELISRGGRRALVHDADWRLIAALKRFETEHGKEAMYLPWRRAGRPLLNLKALNDILRFDQLAQPSQAAPLAVAEPPSGNRAGEASAASPVPSTAPAGILPPLADAVVLGTTYGVRQTAVVVRLAELLQHAAFLGGSGSGKTTAALNVVEQAIAAGIPAILVDRKGDLCGYATDQWHSGAGDTPELVQRRKVLQERIDVAVYTPGNPDGHNLVIPLTPADWCSLTSSEQDAMVRVAGNALAAMMGFKRSPQDQHLLAVLVQAIATLAHCQPGIPVTIQGILDLVGGPDPALLTAIYPLDQKVCKKLAERLKTLELLRGELLRTSESSLDIGRLLHSDPTGKTKLSIISTKSLGENTVIEFWMAQFLASIDRWVSKHPSPHLQGLLFLDEADLYLPATHQPATKWPMENLLKRARSGGVGLMLATQSPGDLDYKCRENIRAWFLGRIQQDTALKKLKTVFDSRNDSISRLPGQRTGQFLLVRDGQPECFQSHPSALQTRQLGEDEILRLASQFRRARQPS